MDSQRFNFPSVDSLVEGIDYTEVNWDFVSSSPLSNTPHTPGESCRPNEKMVFGVCRQVGGAGKTQQETQLEGKAAKEGSKFENNKQISEGGKKYGWAMKNGKPILVEWGSVAGVKKVGPKAPSAKTQRRTPQSTSSPSDRPAPSATPAQRPAAAAAPVSDAAAYKAGGGNAAVQRGMGSTIDQVRELGRKNLQMRP